MKRKTQNPDEAKTNGASHNGGEATKRFRPELYKSDDNEDIEVIIIRRRTRKEEIHQSAVVVLVVVVAVTVRVL